MSPVCFLGEIVRIVLQELIAWNFRLKRSDSIQHVVAKVWVSISPGGHIPQNPHTL